MTQKDMMDTCAKCKLGMHCWLCSTNAEYIKHHPYKKGDERDKRILVPESR
jgi:hypothetical protein